MTLRDRPWTFSTEMAVLVELEIAAANTVLGQATTASPGTHISLEQIVPTSDAAIPYFWVETDDFEGFEAAVRDHPNVTELKHITTVDGRRLYRIYWAELGPFVDALTTSDATILDGHGSDPWTFRLLFPSRADVTTFRELCTDADIVFDVRRVSDLTENAPQSTYNLTDEQYEALLLAIERGYYSIPRQVTLAELAEDVGISQQAMSERLRRGTAKVLVHLVDGDKRIGS